MSPVPKIIICGRLVWAAAEAEEIFRGVAEIIPFESKDRASFLSAFQSGGEYADVVGIYRDNASIPILGVYNKELIGGLGKTKYIAHNGAGYDMIDTNSLKEHGILLSNTPGAVDEATATTALFLLISAIRQFSFGERVLRANQWRGRPTVAPRAHDLANRTVAILGLGGIGLRFAEMVKLGFPTMRIIYHSRNPKSDAPDWCEYFSDVDEMLKQADVLSVHVPLNKNTEGLVGEKVIRTMKKGGIIINTARGKVIDEEALIRALEDGHLASVGLDVFPNEPEVNPRLLEFDNATLLPHMGTETQDSQKAMEIRALNNLKDFITKGQSRDLVSEMK